MKKMEWEKSKQLINKKPCLQHMLNKDDLQIHGRNGVLIQTGDVTFQAVFHNNRAYNKIAGGFGLMPTAVKGEELFIRFGMRDFKQIHKALRVPKSLEDQQECSKLYSNVV